ncbi:ficolin-2 [Drosophila innubila]|uniref:ficolin-2 n=1 Tax=Drosophila innubila TaxID=198719 RepID=UPI00148C5BB6|nr:ficolin-2 [Drosophila innubila]
MSTFGNFVVILCCLSQAIAVDHSLNGLLGGVNFTYHEVQSGESNSNILRLYRELGKLNDLFVNHLKNNYNNCTPPGNEIKAVDIVRKVLDSNEIYSLNTLRSSCPAYRDSNGIFTIKVFGLEPFKILCNSDIAGPGWTVIASRSNDNLNFYRGWAEYKRGFGNLTGDFFIGLDKLHAITISQPHELYIYLEDFDGNKRFAKYDEFLIGTETEKYVMAKLGTYVGDMGDSLKNHANRKFTTHDNDNDVNSSSNCAVLRMGAWWYYNCEESNLFGLYLNGSYGSELTNKGMYWSTSRGVQYSHKVMRMMVRPKCSCPH